MRAHCSNSCWIGVSEVQRLWSKIEGLGLVLGFLAIAMPILSAESQWSTGRFLFVDEEQQGQSDRYLSIGRIGNQGSLQTTRLMKIRSYGYYSVAGVGGRNEIWIHSSAHKSVLCFDAGPDLVTAALHAEGVIGAAPDGLLIVRYHKAEVSEMLTPKIVKLDFKTHEANTVQCPVELDFWIWRAAAVSPNGVLLALTT